MDNNQRIVGASVSHENEIKWVPFDDQIPMQYKESGSRTGGFIMASVGVVWIVFISSYFGIIPGSGKEIGFSIN